MKKPSTEDSMVNENQTQSYTYIMSYYAKVSAWNLLVMLVFIAIMDNKRIFPEEGIQWALIIKYLVLYVGLSIFATLSLSGYVYRKQRKLNKKH